MSNPDYDLKLSEEAYDDLINIQNYTFSFYGEDGWIKYGHALDEAMKHIQFHPHSGHHREDIPQSYLAWNINEHIMIYRIEDQVIYLVRVLHGKMDFRFQFFL